MNNIPTAEEFVNQYDWENSTLDIPSVLREFAKLHVAAALKAALEEVPYGGSDPIHYEDVVGILKCYPLDNIK